MHITPHPTPSSQYAWTAAGRHRRTPAGHDAACDVFLGYGQPKPHLRPSPCLGRCEQRRLYLKDNVDQSRQHDDQEEKHSEHKEYKKKQSKSNKSRTAREEAESKGESEQYEQLVQAKIASLGVCPMSFLWMRVPGGYQC